MSPLYRAIHSGFENLFYYAAKSPQRHHHDMILLPSAITDRSNSTSFVTWLSLLADFRCPKINDILSTCARVDAVGRIPPIPRQQITLPTVDDTDQVTFWPHPVTLVREICQLASLDPNKGCFLRYELSDHVFEPNEEYLTRFLCLWWRKVAFSRSLPHRLISTHCE